MTTTTIPATDKQTAFIVRLCGERDYSGLNATAIDAAVERGLNKDEASMLISMLLDAPRAAVTTEANNPVLTEGFYLYAEQVFTVVKAKHSDRLYAKRLVITGRKGSWEYEAGAMRWLAAEGKPLSIEVAAEMGARYGVCVVCGRTLTDPESVERGIGPVCSARL